ncbi:MAG: class I tRNA ligase family protein, partial [Candidatus Micrarchaeota archaeon]|nr:class I tRNA ligase family protein [Candidatus Micrarchaeota archaeon]
MALRFQNTLSKRKEDFVPVNQGKVGMYVCGVTPYDQCHIGHGRAGVAFDVIRRYLQFKGYDVKYVTNFTDVDDKIIKRASDAGMEPLKLAQKYIDEYFGEFDALGVKRADVYPKATEHIHDMIRLIESLIAKGYAYEAGGDVFFEVSKFKDYGKLSGQPLGELLA